MRETNKSNITTVSIRLNPDKEDDRKIMDILDGIVCDEELSEKYGGKTGYIKMAIQRMVSKADQNVNQAYEESVSDEKTESTELKTVSAYAYADVADEEGYVDIDVVSRRFLENRGYLIPPRVRYHH
ncbi:MAG: hypothetical protein J5684_00640 [Eubacterium sp.]|nr:hypothetical protein [Eubacterium sp.]